MQTRPSARITARLTAGSRPSISSASPSSGSAIDKQLISAKSERPAKREATAEQELRDRPAAIDTRLADIERRLADDFPNYAALSSPTPISAAEVQAQLGAGEALVLFLETKGFKPLPEETFIWVVTKAQVRWVRSELGTAALADEVAALRCGLDCMGWRGHTVLCRTARHWDRQSAAV
jgi:hypothetical protein